jgi:hypothetical protein
VLEGFGSLKGFLAMVRGSFSSYRDEHALKLLNDPPPQASLVQIEQPERAHELILEETNQ